MSDEAHTARNEEGQADSEPMWDEHGNFLGHEPRECGEHRTVGSYRAWCFDCGEWCYPGDPCVRCEGRGATGLMHDDQVDRTEEPAGDESPPSIVFDVPSVRWPTEGTFTLVRDLGVHVGSTFTLTDRIGKETVYRVTHVDGPDDDDPDPRWTVSVVEWEA